jgi:hypothetical protein
VLSDFDAHDMIVEQPALGSAVVPAPVQDVVAVAERFGDVGDQRAAESHVRHL